MRKRAINMPRVSVGVDSIQFDRRSVCVLGASSSGQAIARHCLRRGDRVFLSDNDPNCALESRTAGLAGELSFCRGRHDLTFVARADLIVLSPGVPLDCEPIKRAFVLEKTVQTAVEFTAAEHFGDLIIVTGTSGKTTTIDVLRKLVSASGRESEIALTDRRNGIGIASSLEKRGARTIIAEASVSELAETRSLSPDLLVVTSLSAENNHIEFDDFPSYLNAKLGWLASLDQKVTILSGASEADAITNHFDGSGPPGGFLEFEIVPDGVGPMLALAERVRRIMKWIGLEDSASPRAILDAIRATLLERCESIEGFAMPILNIGECKNPDSLAWTADAICADPRIITARPLGIETSGSPQNVIDLNERPVGIERAIEIWTTETQSGNSGTVVIDEVTRKKLFANSGSLPKAAGPI